MAEEEISGSLRMTGYEPLPVGIMTSASRDVWAGVRRKLAEGVIIFLNFKINNLFELFLKLDVSM